MNDLFWGLNFTDWETTKLAEPLYKKHKQPFLPSKLGYYDLRNVDAIKKQATMARNYGVDGFAIYHYFFDKKTKALDTPVNIIRNNSDIDIDYYLCWVNVDWSKSWVGDHNTLLYKQGYTEDTIKELAKNACHHFADRRYYKINNIPLFHIHEPYKIDFARFKQIFLKHTSLNGFPKVLFCAPEIHVKKSQINNLDYLTGYPPGDFSFLKLKMHLIYSSLLSHYKYKIIQRLFSIFSTLHYPRYVNEYLRYIDIKCSNKKYIPTVLSGWDNTPRYKHRGFLFSQFNGEHFGRLCRGALNASIKNNKEFFMIKAWNEWAEGNVMEPSEQFGFSMLENFSNAKNCNQINT